MPYVSNLISFWPIRTKIVIFLLHLVKRKNKYKCCCFISVFKMLCIEILKLLLFHSIDFSWFWDLPAWPCFLPLIKIYVCFKNNTVYILLWYVHKMLYQNNHKEGWTKKILDYIHLYHSVILIKCYSMWV